MNRKCYETWKAMKRRCLVPINRNITYKECSICEEWQQYRNFEKWYNENYYEIDDIKMTLDKDILFKGNKIYSPKTCIFVPSNINALFVKSNKIRGQYPIGVHYHKNSGKFHANCKNNNGKRTYLGSFDSPEEAFLTYKTYKENLIKEVAKKYKTRIPNILYEAMFKYEVEIID